MMDVIVNSELKVPISNHLQATQKNYYQNILYCLDYKQEQPLAQLIRLYHQLNGQWIIASPVHWEATHNDAMLVAAGEDLKLFENESFLWFSEVAEFLKSDGFAPVYHDAHHWLFRVDDKPKIKSQAVANILSQSLWPILNGLDSTLYWQRLLTELQMFLSSHPLNLKRQGLAINGLWFWGEGVFQLKNLRPIATDDKVLYDFAAASGGSVCGLSEINSFVKEQLIIVHDLNQIEFDQLKQKIAKNSVDWYWTNCKYSSKSSSWWSRFRRK